MNPNATPGWADFFSLSCWPSPWNLGFLVRENCNKTSALKSIELASFAI